MTIQHLSFGPALIEWNGYQIGYGRDGVDVSIDPKWNDIPSDLYGGAGGVPSDAQLLGSIVRVSTELTAFEKNQVLRFGSFDRLHAQLANGLGSVYNPIIGTFVRQGTNALGGLLQLDTTAALIKFPVAFFRQPQDFNVGTRATFYMVGWECWIDGASTRKLLEFAAAS